MKRKILIAGPVGEIGGVRTHVEHLVYSFKKSHDYVHVVNGASIIEMVFANIYYRPDVTIFNLSLYRNQILRSIIVRFFLLLNFKSIYILHLHGGSLNSIKFFKKRICIFFLRLFFNRFDCIFCLTVDQFTDVRKFNKKAAKKIFNYVKIPDDPFTQKDKGVINFLFIGRLELQKGVMVAINAIKRCPLQNIRFWIIGSGSLEREIYDENDPRIVFLGKKIGDEKVKYLTKSHVFVLPSYAEAMPYALLEAAAYGLAIIASNVGSIEQIVINGKNGYFVKPGDVNDLQEKIENLALDSRLLVEMGKESRNICSERFSIEKLQKLYREILV